MLGWLAERWGEMRWDGWEALGLLGEGLFFARLAVQWAASERERKPVLPVAYWYLSLAGAVLLVFYALHLGSFVILLPQLVGGLFYVRGLQLEIAHRRRERHRREAGFDRPGFPWPALTVIVPVHNEAAALPATLESLRARAAEYPGPRTRLVVAVNGSVDDSEIVARSFLATATAMTAVEGLVIADARAGMSFGKNLGARAANDADAVSTPDADFDDDARRGRLWLFIDADTALPEGAFAAIAEAAHGVRRPVGTVAGRADRGGPVVRICFALANRFARRGRAHAPGGVMLMTPGVFAAAGGFDEELPQGTSTDFIQRALAAGANYVFVDSVAATTSIRRFEKTGIIRQMLAWRRNHRDLRRGRRAAVGGRPYDNIR